MKTWQTTKLPTQGRKPEILDSGDDARAVVIDLPAGESLTDHQVHERAWVVVVAGEIEVTAIDAPAGQGVVGGVGFMVEFEPLERHRVDALADSRFVLLLTPWPGSGHPGTLTLDEKAQVRERAAEHGAAD